MVRTKRSYPEKELFAHVLGYVAEANEQEMANDPALAMGDLVGKQGLELELEKQLRGRKGLYDVEVDAHARVLGKTLREEPRGGHEMRLSLDRGLQQAAWDALDGEAGCVVVMEPDSGKLRALVTSPAYDNNLFAAGISQRDWDALRTSNRFPLQNRVIQSVYPPGSVWKLVMAALFLERGINPRETVFCPGQVKLGNQIFRCWKTSISTSWPSVWALTSLKNLPKLPASGSPRALTCRMKNPAWCPRANGKNAASAGPGCAAKPITSPSARATPW